MSTVIEVITPFDQTQAIVVLMAVALFYATFSGFYGVVTTDVVQFLLPWVVCSPSPVLR